MATGRRSERKSLPKHHSKAVVYFWSDNTTAKIKRIHVAEEQRDSYTIGSRVTVPHASSIENDAEILFMHGISHFQIHPIVLSL